MKAVILAGGEGTRLRPLTSNQPKPMMPIANVPMMEHIVRLLARHGFDDIVVTVAFLANHIRNYFGDGSDFDVRMRYATEESPLGTAGSVRNAMDELDETFLVISGDVLTDVDLGAFVDAHREQRGVRVDRVEAGREPGRVRHRHHPRRRHDRALPREADVGRGVLRHDQHRDLRARARGVRPHPRRRGRRLLGRRVPGDPRTTGGKLYGHVVDGYWEDVGTLEAYRTAHEDILDGRVADRDPGLPGARAGVARRERRRLARRRGRRAGAHRRQLPHRGGRGAAAVHRARRRRRREGRRAARAQRRARPRLHRAVDARARRGARPRRATSATACASRKASSSATSRFIGADAIINPSVKIYPFKSVDTGARRHVVDRVGEPGRAHAVRPARCARPRQRRHHLRGRGAPRDGVRHRARRRARSSARAATRAAPRVRSSGRSSPA